MRDQFDIVREDDEFLSEMEWAAKLISAATAFDGPMSRLTIDRILEVHYDGASTD